eukprot:3851426-Ditylum_brightwellii.AAC.1
MAHYNHNPIKLMEEMELSYNKIMAVSQEKVIMGHNFTHHIFRALCTTSNPDFLHYIKAKKDLHSKTIYVNNKEECNCGNPKDNSILALTTKLTHLENKLKENQPIGGGGGKESTGGCSNGGRNGGGGGNDLPKWRTVKAEEEITCDNQDWIWCPDYHKEDRYDGIHMPAPPHNHAEWLETVKAQAVFHKKKKEEKEVSKITTTSST